MFMDKEQLKKISVNALIVAKIKMDILNKILSVSEGTNRPINKQVVIDAINELPISRFEKLFDLIYLRPLYAEKIKEIVLEVCSKMKVERKK